MKDLDTGTFRHCDDYIDDPSTPEVVRSFLRHARSPAHGAYSAAPLPRLFATYDGKRYRAVMASRLGDVGLTEHLDREIGYQIRVNLEHLTDLSDQP